MVSHWSSSCHSALQRPGPTVLLLDAAQPPQPVQLADHADGHEARQGLENRHRGRDRLTGLRDSTSGESLVALPVCSIKISRIQAQVEI